MTVNYFRKKFHHRHLAVHCLFYKQPVYKQLAFEWQIAKPLSGLNPVLLSNNENYRLRESEVFPL